MYGYWPHLVVKKEVKNPTNINVLYNSIFFTLLLHLLCSLRFFLIISVPASHHTIIS